MTYLDQLHLPAAGLKPLAPTTTTPEELTSIHVKSSNNYYTIFSSHPVLEVIFRESLGTKEDCAENDVESRM